MGFSLSYSSVVVGEACALNSSERDARLESVGTERSMIFLEKRRYKFKNREEETGSKKKKKSSTCALQSRFC